MEEFHCAQQQCKGTPRMMSSVTNGLTFVFLQAAQSSITGDPLCRIVQTLPVPTPKAAPRDEPASLDMWELKHRKVKGLAQGHAESLWQSWGGHPHLLFPAPGALHTPSPMLSTTWPSRWLDFTESLAHVFTLFVLTSGFQGSPDELILVLGERRCY